MHVVAILFLVLLAVLPASAQVAPTEAELRAYNGLHAAAARGDRRRDRKADRFG